MQTNTHRKTNDNTAPVPAGTISRREKQRDTNAPGVVEEQKGLSALIYKSPRLAEYGRRINWLHGAVRQKDRKNSLRDYILRKQWLSSMRGGLHPAGKDKAGEAGAAGFKLLRNWKGQAVEKKKGAIGEKKGEKQPGKEKERREGAIVAAAEAVESTQQGAAAAVLPGEPGVQAGPAPKPPKPGQAKEIGAAGTSAGTASQFLTSTPTNIAANIKTFGSSLTTSLKSDNDNFNKKSIKIEGGMTTGNIPIPGAAAPPPLPPVPETATWQKPAAGAQRKDAPTFVPQAGADPQQVEENENSEKSGVLDSAAAANKEITDHPAEKTVRGIDREFQQPVKIKAEVPEMQVNQTQAMKDYLAMDIPAGIRGAVDQKSAAAFQDKLARPKQGIEDAISSRDKKINTAVADSNQRAEQLTAAANQNQEAAIQKARDDISLQKQKSLEENDQIRRDFYEKAGAEKAKTQGDINNEIQKSETKAVETLDNADKKAAEEKKKADQKAAAEKAKEPKPKGLGALFKSILKAFFKALAKAVTGIVKAMEKAVKFIVETAAKAAKGLIDKCQQFAAKAVATFAKVIKSIASVALAAFPGVRDKFMAFVDKAAAVATEIVTKIADELKSKIDDAAAELNAMISYAASAYTALVNGFCAIACAVVDGDFRALLKAVFITACESAGVPGPPMWAIVERAESQVWEILKNPVPFLANLVKSAAQGLTQFMNNAGTHIKKGLIGWLLGKAAAAGVEPPTSLDAGSIFTFVRKLFGFDYQYIRQRALSKLGPRSAVVVGKVLDYIELLFKEGPRAVYEEMKREANENTKEKLLQMFIDWAVNTVVARAVMKLTSMMVPGANLVQAIYSAWQTIKFIREKAQEVAQLISSILDSIQMIIKGAVGAAAKKIEQTLVVNLPLLFDFLARQVGLGDLTAKIAAIVEKLRTPVNTVVDKFMEAVISAAEKGKAGIKKLGAKLKAGISKAGAKIKEKVSAWYNKKKKFTTKDGETHEISFKGQKQPVPIIASTPVPVKERLTQWKPRLKDKDKSVQSAWEKADTTNTNLEFLSREEEIKTHHEERNKLNKGSEAENMMSDLSTAMTVLFSNLSREERIKDAKIDFIKQIEGGMTEEEIKTILNKLKAEYTLHKAIVKVLPRHEGKAKVYLGDREDGVIELTALQSNNAIQTKLKETSTGMEVKYHPENRHYYHRINSPTSNNVNETMKASGVLQFNDKKRKAEPSTAEVKRICEKEREPIFVESTSTFSGKWTKDVTKSFPRSYEFNRTEQVLKHISILVYTYVKNKIMKQEQEVQAMFVNNRLLICSNIPDVMNLLHKQLQEGGELLKQILNGGAILLPDLTTESRASRKMTSLLEGNRLQKVLNNNTEVEKIVEILNTAIKDKSVIHSFTLTEIPNILSNDEYKNKLLILIGEKGYHAEQNLILAYWRADIKDPAIIYGKKRPCALCLASFWLASQNTNKNYIFNPRGGGFWWGPVKALTHLLQDSISKGVISNVEWEKIIQESIPNESYKTFKIKKIKHTEGCNKPQLVTDYATDSDSDPE